MLLSGRLMILSSLQVIRMLPQWDKRGVLKRRVSNVGSSRARPGRLAPLVSTRRWTRRSLGPPTPPAAVPLLPSGEGPASACSVQSSSSPRLASVRLLRQELAFGPASGSSTSAFLPPCCCGSFFLREMVVGLEERATADIRGRGHASATALALPFVVGGHLDVFLLRLCCVMSWVTGGATGDVVRLLAIDTCEGVGQPK